MEKRNYRRCLRMVALTAFLLCLTNGVFAQNQKQGNDSRLSFQQTETVYTCLNNVEGFVIRNSKDDIYICGSYGIAYKASNQSYHFSFTIFAPKEEKLFSLVKGSEKDCDGKVKLVFEDGNALESSSITRDEKNHYMLIFSTKENEIVQEFLTKDFKYVSMNGDKYWLETVTMKSSLVYRELAWNLEDKYNLHGVFKRDFTRDKQEIRTISRKVEKKTEPKERIMGETTVFAKDLVKKIYGVVDGQLAVSTQKEITRELKKHFSDVGKPDFTIPGRKVICVRDLNLKYNGVKMDPQDSNVQFKKGKLCCYGYSFTFDSSYSMDQIYQFASDLVRDVGRLGGPYRNFRNRDNNLSSNLWAYFRSCTVQTGDVKSIVIVSIMTPKENEPVKVDLSVSHMK